MVLFFKSCSKKFNSSSCSKKFNSSSHVQKVQFFESCSKRVQFFESQSKKRRFKSLSHIGKQERFNSLSHIEKRLQLCQSYWEEVHKRGSILWVIYKEFNFLSHFSQKKISILWVFFLTQGSILWIIFLEKKRFNSMGLLKKEKILWVSFFLISILWVMSEKKS